MSELSSPEEQQGKRFRYFFGANVLSTVSLYAEQGVSADLHVLPAHHLRGPGPEQRRDELHLRS